MKKRLTITIILILLAAVGIVTAHLLTNHNGQDVKITETTLAGDFDAAKGLAVTTEIQVDHGKNCMAWETSTILNEQLKTESEMRQGEPITEEYHRLSLDVLLTSGGSEVVDGYDITNGDYCSNIPVEVFEDLGKKIEPGETIEEIVNLGDYLDTVEMDYYFDSYDPNRNYVRELSIMESEESLFRSYFTVDAPEDYPVTFTVTKEKDGVIRSVYYMSEKEASASTASVITEDFCYIAVNGYLYDNQFYPLQDHDYSGILRIPLSQTRQLQVKEIEKIYDLSDDVFIEKLSLSDDGQRLLLLTTENGTTYLHVFDKETMQRKQKLPLQFSHHLDADMITSVLVGPDYYAAITYEGEYVILSYLDGTYQPFTSGQFDLSKLENGDMHLSFLHCDIAADFQTGKAAIAALAYDKNYNITPSFYVQVRNQNDLLYYGLFDSSLTEDLAVRNIMDDKIEIDFVR